jgi:hypothetical protein
MNTKNAFGLLINDKFQRGALVWEVVGIYDLSVTRRQYTIKRVDINFTTTLVVDAYEPCKPFKMV